MGRRRMGRHQRAETAGLVAFLVCAAVAATLMTLYLDHAPAIWQVTQRRFMACAGIVAACAVVSFCIGYLSRSRTLRSRIPFLSRLRRLFETFALSGVYAATVFLSTFALLGAANEMMGNALFAGYLTAACAGFAGVAGYMTMVQAETMNAKTLASLLPFFVVSGVSTAGLTTDDPYWYHNNFSQLGDRTTFAARMFNSTLVMAGICIIIISYFAVSELRATERLRAVSRARGGPGADGDDDAPIAHFRLRIALLSVLLTLSGLDFIGVGAFRYTPHPIMHNVCAQSLPGVMVLLFLLLPWLAPRLSRATMVVSDLATAVCAGFWVAMMLGRTTLTNVEALAGLSFLGWFLVFSRQIAAIEADRVALQLLWSQTASDGSAPDAAPDTAPVLGEEPGLPDAPGLPDEPGTTGTRPEPDATDTRPERIR